MTIRRSAAALAAVALLPLTALPATAAPSLAWSPCPTEAEPTLQCATVEVPVDRAVPGAGIASLAMAKLPATDSAHRIGSLLFNPGGPGGSGVDWLKFGIFAKFGMPEAARLRQRFDIVGFDPRGVGESTPAITCDPATLRDPSVNRRPATRRAFEAMVAANRKAGLDCLSRTGPMLGQADTIDAADDVEAIRIALGEPKVNWLGLSYGTELGAVYASRYPDRVRTMVLDGAVHHARPLRQAVIEETAAGDDALRRFAAWCDRTADCALHGQDVLKYYDELTARADRVGVWSSHLGRKATGEEITAGVAGLLIGPIAWPELGKGLAAAGGPRPDAAGLTQNSQFGDLPGYASYLAIGCQDFPSPFTGPADLAATDALVRLAAPHTWRYSEYRDITVGCTGWPVPAKNPPARHPVHGAPPILVIGGAHDPATPLAWARALAAEIDGSVLLTRLDDGHTGWVNTPCARAATVDYLVSGVTPARGTVCR